MEIKIIEHNSPDYKKMVALRDKILRKPLGLQFSPIDLAREKDNILILAEENGLAAGCCMLVRESDKIIRLKQMAVDNTLQKHGVGSMLVGFCEELAVNNGYTQILLHAREAAMGFYEKLGYTAFGERFEEVNIPHFAMLKDL